MRNEKLLVIFILFLFICIHVQAKSDCPENDSPEIKFLNNCNKENPIFSLIFNFKINFVKSRLIFWKQPCSTVPEEGYPVVFLFHGAVQHGFAWFIGLNSWSVKQTLFTKELLEQGFFVVGLESLRPYRPGPRAWDGFTKNISESDDLQYIQNVINWLNNSDLPIDLNRLYCTGFSSGSFMCSRIGHAMGSTFNAIIIHSGANADSVFLTDFGPVFDLENSYDFSSNYPPTLIIHGTKDSLIPADCAINYFNDLRNNSIISELFISEDKGHIWISEFNTEIIDWFREN